MVGAQKNKDIITSEVRLKHIHLYSIFNQGSESVTFKTLIEGHMVANITCCTTLLSKAPNPNMDSYEATKPDGIFICKLSCLQSALAPGDMKPDPTLELPDLFNTPPDNKLESRALS